MWHIERLSKEQVEQMVGNKLNSIKSKTKDSLHHILPKSRESEWYRTHEEQAQVVLEQDFHQKFHQLFENLLPHEQFIFLFAVNDKVISDYFAKWFKGIEVQEFYKEDLLFKNNY